jgi:hypothetical protein
VAGFVGVQRATPRAVAAPEAVAAVAIDHSGSNRYKLQLETSAATGVALMRAQHTPTGPGPDRGETLVVQANGAVIPGESRP